MKKHLKIITLLCLWLVCLPSVHAMMPVFDASALQNSLLIFRQLKDQYEQLKEQINLVSNQVELQKKNLGSITGVYGMGSLLNSATDFNNRQWAPSTWENALKGIAGGNDQRYQQLLAAYQQAHPVMSNEKYAQIHSKEHTALYQDSVETVQAAATTAQVEYNKMGDHLDDLHQLGDEIEKSSNRNTKSAIDLNTRMVQELGYLMLEMARMQATLISLQAQVQMEEVQSQSLDAQFLSS